MMLGPRVLAAIRLVHLAPTVAVVTLSAALAAILATQAGLPDWWRIGLIVASVLGSQIFTGALNDWADRTRDAIAQPTKPIPSGAVSADAALALAAAGLVLQAGASAPLGVLPLSLGLAASGSAVAYNLWLSRTPLSIVPYLVSFGILPLWIAAGVGVELDRVAVASLLVGPFAAAAHLANTLRDYDADAAIGSRNLAQVLGRRNGLLVAWVLAMGVGGAVGIGFTIRGEIDAVTAAFGAVGLVAIAQGLAGPNRLWIGILVAAVSWTAGWALASG